MPTDPKDAHALRRRAEKLLVEAPEKLARASAIDLQKIVHEISVHQIELEMQNDELRRSREELEQSRSEYTELYDFAPVGYLTFDREGLITRANLTACGLLGVEKSRLVDKPFALFVQPESQDVFCFHNQKVSETTAAQTCHLDLKKRDGTFFHARLDSIGVEINGQRATHSVLTDVTERRKGEDALRESETKLRAILDGSRDAIGVSKNGLHTFANPAYVSLFGYQSDDELLGTPIIQLIAPESRGLIEERVEKRAAGEPVPSFYEATGLKTDGTTFLMEVTVSAYTLKGEQFSLVIMRDITEKKRLEEQLSQAQKMEAVGTLAGGVAHDFNNILTVIMGLGSLMQMSIGEGDAHRTHIDQIVASSERAADLTRSLLAFSRKQRITLEPHKVNGVVTSTGKLLKRLLPEDVLLSMNLTDKDTSGLLDVTQIGQALMNLATNARDAMPHGGSLAITTERAQIDEAFMKAHGFGCAGDYVKLSVSDTGIGMDEGTMKRIFEPFFTTKEVGKGTGLGLASVYGIVKQHDGCVTVSSAPFAGTTFDIYLPLSRTLSRRKAPVKEDIREGTETILIVEDDQDVRKMLTKILESHGYTTIEAVDGNDAIGVHNAHREHIDLIILDVVMPGRNGQETLDEITRTDPGVRTIFVSGYTGDVVLDKGVHRESVDFLPKPLSVTALLAKVREVLDR